MRPAIRNGCFGGANFTRATLKLLQEDHERYTNYKYATKISVITVSDLLSIIHK